TIRGRFPFHAGSAAPKTGDTLLTRSVQYPGGSPHQGDHGHAPSTAPGYSLGDVMHSRIGHARNRGITAVQDLSGICRAVTPLLSRALMGPVFPAFGTWRITADKKSFPPTNAPQKQNKSWINRRSAGR